MSTKNAAREKNGRHVAEVMVVTPELVRSWRQAPFQRPLIINAMCREVVEQIRSDGGEIPGVITLGVLGGVTYRVDGQHRCECFLLTELKEGIARVRVDHYDNMGEMAEEFVHLNSSLRRMAPDDVLRGLENSHEPLRLIRKQCPFVGYDGVRRNDHSPVVSMSLVIRMWKGSSADIPAASTCSATSLASAMTGDEALRLVRFLGICFEAWSRDPEYNKVWSAINLGMCAWIYRRMVLSQYSPTTPRLDNDLFRKCLMSVSADKRYLEWLVGRTPCERDRSPAYGRLRKIFASRLDKELGKKTKMPAPAWYTTK